MCVRERGMDLAILRGSGWQGSAVAATCSGGGGVAAAVAWCCAVRSVVRRGVVRLALRCTTLPTCARAVAWKIEAKDACDESETVAEEGGRGARVVRWRPRWSGGGGGREGGSAAVLVA